MNEYVDNEARKARLVGKTVTMAHGAGGHQTSELIDMIFKAHFDLCGAFCKSGPDCG